MQYGLFIDGLTCENCASKAKKAITAISANIDVLSVNYLTGEIKYNAPNRLSVSTLNAALKKVGNYTIRNSNELVTKKTSILPLLAILITIALAALIVNMFIRDWSLSGFMFDYMGVFFVVFSIFKLLDVKGFQQAFARYDPLAKMSKNYGFAYPFIEMALGILLLTRTAIMPVLGLTIILLGLTTWGVINVLRDKKSIQCACLGNVIKLPMTTATLVENLIMIVMAAIMLVVHFS